MKTIEMQVQERTNYIVRFKIKTHKTWKRDHVITCIDQREFGQIGEFVLYHDDFFSKKMTSRLIQEFLGLFENSEKVVNGLDEDVLMIELDRDQEFEFFNKFFGERKLILVDENRIEL